MNDVRLKYKAVGALKVTANAKLIYAALIDLARESREISISMRKISKDLGISRKTVSKNIKRLEKAEAIVVLSQYHPDGGRTMNKYVMR